MVEAKAERKNKNEANQVCNEIEQFPSRDDTTAKLFQVNDEIGTLERATVSLKQRLENWIKQFEAVAVTVNDLNQLLEQDIEGDIVETDKAEAMEVDTVKS